MRRKPKYTNVECPKCEAKTGNLCQEIVVGGGGKIRSEIHLARILRSLEKKDMMARKAL